jgi:hypothetical protein
MNPSKAIGVLSSKWLYTNVTSRELRNIIEHTISTFGARAPKVDWLKVVVSLINLNPENDLVSRMYQFSYRHLRANRMKDWFWMY